MKCEICDTWHTKNESHTGRSQWSVCTGGRLLPRGTLSVSSLGDGGRVRVCVCVCVRGRGGSEGTWSRRREGGGRVRMCVCVRERERDRGIDRGSQREKE